MDIQAGKKQKHPLVVNETLRFVELSKFIFRTAKTDNRAKYSKQLHISHTNILKLSNFLPKLKSVHLKPITKRSCELQKKLCFSSKFNPSVPYTCTCVIKVTQ